LISGVSLKGDTFFYPNPLESDGRHARQEWFGVACCPGNITRFMASVPGYIYAKNGDTLSVNLFAGGSADVELAGGKLKIVQDTRYPWDGAVKMTITPERSRQFAINVRVPGWAREEPVPGDLYDYADPAAPPATLAVNGQAVAMKLDKGYVTVNRTWRAGDLLELNLPMPVRRVAAHKDVAADRDRVALQRGPIVYAAEWTDNPNGKVRNLMIPDGNRLAAEFRKDLLNGTSVITGRSLGLSYDEKGQIQKTEQAFTAIPYALWANRGRGEMLVWIPRNEAVARPTPYPTLATAATVTVSVPGPGRGKRPQPINDGEDPKSSDDPSSYFDWWPTAGSKMEWVEMTFAKPATVSEVQVYWFDDAVRNQGVRVPASWKLLYKDGNDWKPVDTTDAFGVARDSFNKLTFKSVTTSALRIELAMRCDAPAAEGQKPRCYSAGLQEWKAK
jgi:hypothetical protein